MVQKKRICLLLVSLVSLNSLFSQIQFAGVNFQGTYAVNTNNHLGHLYRFPKTEFALFQAMQLGPDGKIYFNDFTTVGVIETTGSNRTVLATFSSIIRGELCIANDGKIYVTTVDNKLYRIEPDGSGKTEIASVPYTLNLTASADNWLFGITENTPKVLFKIRTDGSNYTELKTFVLGTEGGGVSKLSYAPNNRLYGSFRSGGPGFGGTFFRIDTTGSNFQILYTTISAADAVAPQSVPFYQNGKIFVSTESGGSFGGGAILAVDTNGLNATKILEMGSPAAALIGNNCVGGLTGNGSGKLFGCTTQNGTVFSMNEDGSSPTVLYTTSPSSLYYSTNFPLAPILIGGGNTLLFQSNMGGFNGGGYLYSVETNGTNAQLVYNHGFNADGTNPSQGLIKDGSDNLYGVFYQGGAGGGGVVYKHSSSGAGFTVLHHFLGTQARNPNGRLLLASDGMLYGVCLNGSNSSNLYRGGAIYRLNPDGSGFQIIKEFNTGTSTVCSPSGGLVEGIGGELYGTTQDAYTSNGAVSIYRINKDGTGFTILKTLNQTFEGFNAVETLTLSGNYLYGTCTSGGSSGSGTAYRIQTNGSGFQVLKQSSFSGPDGALPLSGITLASNGRLYGTTSFGGSTGAGTLYTLNPDGTNFITLLTFDAATQGTISLTKLKQAPDGNLYGTMQNGGTNGTGVFFRYNIFSNTYSVIRHFNSNEFGSLGELVQIPFSATLPIELTSFELRKLGANQASIQWTTAKEINFEKFIVEKSYNGKDFKTFAEVLPKPTTVLLHQYELVDRNPGLARIFYRLKMVDIDKHFSYSKIGFLDFTSSKPKLSIYPNPAKSTITLTNEFSGTTISVTIYDSKGQLVYSKSHPISNNLSITISALPTGTYHLKATDGRNSLSSVFVKE